MASADLGGELTCSICLKSCTDPVKQPCGHNFCQICLSRSSEHQDDTAYSFPKNRHGVKAEPELKTKPRQPKVAETFQSTYLWKEKVGIPCTYCIQSQVPAAKTCLHCEASLCENHLKVHSKSAEHILVEPIRSLVNRKCSVHKKILEYYCSEDSTCICVSCRLDGEHKGHKVKTLNEACEKKKKRLVNILEKLTSKRGEVEKRVQILQKLKKVVQKKASGVTEQVTALIRDIKEQLKVLETRVLSEISQQEEQISHRVSDLIRQMEIKKEELTKKMADVEELCNMTDSLTILQERGSDRADYCDAEEGDFEETARHDKKVQAVGDMDVGLVSVTLHSGLAGIVTGVKRRRHTPEVSDMLLDVKVALDMLLDVKTTSNDVSVSDDLKTASRSESNHSHPETPERFQYYPQILSMKGFSSGRHYWEVEGSESGRWIVGMAYPSIDRRGRQSVIGYNNKSWGLWKWDHDKYSVIHNSKEYLLSNPPTCWRLGILVDYEAGRLSFYELCEPIRHLHTFTAAFTEPLHAIFGVDFQFYKVLQRSFQSVNSWVRITY